AAGPLPGLAGRDLSQVIRSLAADAGIDPVACNARAAECRLSAGSRRVVRRSVINRIWASEALREGRADDPFPAVPKDLVSVSSPASRTGRPACPATMEAR